MALVGPHVAERAAERRSPAHRVALVAGVAEVERVGHLRDVLRDHGAVAAEAAAGEHERVVADGFRRPVRAAETDFPFRDVRNGGGAEQVDAGGRAQERRHESGAGLLRNRVHAQRAVTGVQESLDEDESHAVRVGEPLERRAGGAAHRLDEARIGLAMVLALDVGRHALGRVLDAGRALPARAARRDEA